MTRLIENATGRKLAKAAAGAKMTRMTMMVETMIFLRQP